MAKLENIVLGELDGKLGGVIGRRRGKKYFIYAAPSEVKISNSEAAIKSRNIMKPLSRFSSIVNSIKELKEIWSYSKTEAFDIFHKIEKENFKFFIPERPTINNFIVPIFFGFTNPITESAISKKGVKVKMELGQLFLLDFAEANEITGIGVLCFYNPKEEQMDYFHLSKLITSRIEIKNEGEFWVEIPFNGEDQNNYNSYLNSILYFTLVSKDIKGKAVKCTNNYRSEFVHEIPLIKERFTYRDSRA
jgi:hypothetical protein